METLSPTRQCISKWLHAMVEIENIEKWVPYELTHKQIENRKSISEILHLQHERNKFLHCIFTGDEEWIYIENLKRKKSWLLAGEALVSAARQNHFGKRTLLCVWWDHKGIVFMKWSNWKKLSVEVRSSIWMTIYAKNGQNGALDSDMTTWQCFL